MAKRKARAQQFIDKARRDPIWAGKKIAELIAKIARRAR